MSQFYLSLGSNVGDRENYLRSAVEAISQMPATAIKAVSSFYQTAAWGKTDQDDFLNLCVHAVSDLSPQEFLAHTQTIEKNLGRVRHEHWGPRTLDIDTLLIDDLVIDEPNLKVPHPYMTERAFVLRPLAEIASAVVHPVEGQSIAKLLSQLAEEGVVHYKAY
ncbi:2-amino-4-hydroxy-6-hydroxymethyldihydropteridine diphosphokinase [Streptococcus merionis]|uniref:2-amino-4-hydroxy-6- hydroxymethyldihydropteridine diphosphokinase n=1 Tax=Streptococcus merionis TaxID=400065 RepID=UPI0026EF820B|nr:2-amino-4-hydroxy-6-hydroxymethyldihydropteridine diphosphokinase [Streptococcus merionis]